ncbi:MAG: hypothetical protein LBG80_02295 [Bacteroidales bacterium]|nr:hypothetical protein [Bacteroidales bacterium]
MGKHPTPERNSYAIMEFDFSGLNTSNEEKFEKSFSDEVQQSVQRFLGMYKQIIPNAEHLIRQIEKKKDSGINVLGIAFNAASAFIFNIFSISTFTVQVEPARIIRTRFYLVRTRVIPAKKLYALPF